MINRCQNEKRVIFIIISLQINLHWLKKLFKPKDNFIITKTLQSVTECRVLCLAMLM